MELVTRRETPLQASWTLPEGQGGACLRSASVTTEDGNASPPQHHTRGPQHFHLSRVRNQVCSEGHRHPGSSRCPLSRASLSPRDLGWAVRQRDCPMTGSTVTVRVRPQSFLCAALPPKQTGEGPWGRAGGKLGSCLCGPRARQYPQCLPAHAAASQQLLCEYRAASSCTGEWWALGCSRLGARLHVHMSSREQ